MSAIRDITNMKFGRLTAIRLTNQHKNGSRLWEFQCDCGNIYYNNSREVLSGHTSSCGCLAKEILAKRNTTHRMSRSREYRIWAGVKRRVSHGNNLNQKYYKDKGIVMCNAWFISFEAFYKDMHDAPSNEHQIDRINSNGNYSCGHCEQCIKNEWSANCKWASRIEQMNNTTANRWITFENVTLTLAQWTRKLGFSNSEAITKRLKRGWNIEKALTTPLGKEKGERFIEWQDQIKSLSEWAEITGLSKNLIAWRIDKAKMSVEDALNKPKKIYRGQ